LIDIKRVDWIPGQSVLGELNSPTTCSNVPAQASLWVKKLEERLKIFFMVAGIEECSNSEFSAGPLAPLITENFGPSSKLKLVGMSDQSKAS